MTVDVLLSKLEGVRRTGADRWTARCPGHEDKRASLSIRALDDGRTLLHCFAGCGVEEVLAAVGLDFDALFPERALDHRVPRERRPYSLRDLAAALSHELHVALIVLADAGAGRQVDTDRATVARTRIMKFLGELVHAT